MNTVEETIKMAGFGKRKMMRKQIELFEKDLLAGEELLGVATSFPKPTEQLYVTNKRIFSHKIKGVFENEKVEIPLSSISSVNTKVKGLSAEIEIVTSNNKCSVEKIPLNIAPEIKKLIDSLVM
ncbi:PH domain-containing protein [Bacillus sp. ISL-46]|uniref:PH domain-containing protein n=1 Tax=Bacillus sp. ISL-46 TaxID=2819129 RepID=UPI001BE9B728|nr:PH domain-containing protein [Bacillus sp. ISL-46]MBT2722331.1 PH domain-containing protein [Bacillus sp. ISL-46]